MIEDNFEEIKIKKLENVIKLCDDCPICLEKMENNIFKTNCGHS
jgi:hypothetical protein